MYFELLRAPRHGFIVEKGFGLLPGTGEELRLPVGLKCCLILPDAEGEVDRRAAFLAEEFKVLTSLLRPDVRRSALEECFELFGRTRPKLHFHNSSDHVNRTSIRSRKYSPSNWLAPLLAGPACRLTAISR